MDAALKKIMATFDKFGLNTSQKSAIYNPVSSCRPIHFLRHESSLANAASLLSMMRWQTLTAAFSHRMPRDFDFLLVVSFRRNDRRLLDKNVENLLAVTWMLICIGFSKSLHYNVIWILRVSCLLESILSLELFM